MFYILKKANKNVININIPEISLSTILLSNINALFFEIC